LRTGHFFIVDNIPKRVYTTIRKEAMRMDLGKNLAKARIEAGLSQKELAERLEVHQKDISRWEHNDRSPTAITLGKICKALNASADVVLELK
jgi:transcriptional regulator with XRE-family HTH domain